MTKHLMPYGSSQNVDLIAKVGIDKNPTIKIDYFQPYGSTDSAGVLTKVSPPVPMPPKSPRKVKRLNAEKA